MTKRMLIDASHAEETRVVVLDGNRLEDFDVETSTKRQLKGNIYLAKVVRVEPSLQAAFVEYGGNRHGFLAFSEIHPDYYQIPVADRQRLLEMQAEDARREEEEEDLEMALSSATEHPEPTPQTAARIETKPTPTTQAWAPDAPASEGSPPEAPQAEAPQAEAWAFASTPLLTMREPVVASQPVAEPLAAEREDVPAAADWAKPHVPPLLAQLPASVEVASDLAAAPQIAPALGQSETEPDDIEADDLGGDGIEPLPPPETVGGGDSDSGDDQRERRMPPRFLRNYKIQEVIRRRQIMLIQVVKEERGTKGAALTTYLSLAGRFGVLMPNSPRGGGISRKITSATDRRRLKEVMAELDIPRGMGLIVRTAGANRPKPEIKRDCEYLLRLWDDIRDQTMKSVAPALIYEEASLIKRAIRDVYSRDIDEILVDGEDGWRAAHDFMRMLMPTHAKKVQLWRDGGQPLFARNQVEAQLDSMLMPTVQLRSGGYLVINQAEALVAIDVNSGRSTRERNIEETALRTNLEAADEVARQLRLRDLAGLIVIDFIDMESKRHNAMVERRIKEALKNDRARIQVGHISHFGLLEMSRQRLRPSLAETSFIPCPHCGGTGHVRSTENAAIHVLRGIEDEGSKRRAAEIVVHVSTPVALYLLNHKRERLREIELRYTMRVIIGADDAQIAPQFRIERVRTRSPEEMVPVVMSDRPLPPPAIEEVGDEEEEEEAEAEAEVEVEAEAAGVEDDEDDDSEEDTPEQQTADAAGGADEAERRRKRRRRRRRGKRDEPQSDMIGEPSVDVGEAEEAPALAAASAIPAEQPERTEASAETSTEVLADATAEAGMESGEPAAGSDDDPRLRRRGRRGGRRRRREPDGELSPFAVPGADQPELLPVYAGPTPADPFGGRAFDIFDVMDQAERAAEAKPAPRAASAAEIVNGTAPEPDTAPVEAAAPQPAPPVEPASVEPASVDPASVEPASVDPGSVDMLDHEAVTPVEAVAPAQAEMLEMAAVRPASEIVNQTAPEPAAERILESAEAEPTASTADLAAEFVMPEPPMPQPPMPEHPMPEPPPPEPLIKPILIGAGGETPVEKKRGWWRR